MINHEIYKNNKVIRISNDIYGVGAPENRTFVVDAIVIGGNYPIVARLNYLDIKEGISSREELTRVFSELTMKNWDAINMIFTGFTTGEIQSGFINEESITMSLKFPDTLGVYYTSSRGEYFVPSVMWTKVVLDVINEYSSGPLKHRVGMNNHLKVEVIHRDKRCLCCGKGVKDGVILEIDCIIPIKNGGTQDIDNLQTLCSECHVGNSENHYDFLHT